MAFTHIKVAKDLQELTLHGTKAFPVALYETVMRLDRLDFLPLHWHKEIQFVYVKSGRVQYRVGAAVLVLEEEEGLLSGKNNIRKFSCPCVPKSSRMQPLFLKNSRHDALYLFIALSPPTKHGAVT